VENAKQEVTFEPAHPSENPCSTNRDRAMMQLHVLTPEHNPAFCLPLQEFDVTINNDIKVMAIFDTGSQIIVIWWDLVNALRVPINMQCTIEMEGANGATNWTVGCVEFLTMQVSNVPFQVHVHIVENTNFSLLLGHPFQQTLLCRFKDLPGGEVEVSVRDPTNIACRVYI